MGPCATALVCAAPLMLVGDEAFRAGSLFLAHDAARAVCVSDIFDGALLRPLFHPAWACRTGRREGGERGRKCLLPQSALCVTCVPSFDCAAAPALHSAATTASKWMGLAAIDYARCGQSFAAVSGLFGPILCVLSSAASLPFRVAHYAGPAYSKLNLPQLYHPQQSPKS